MMEMRPDLRIMHQGCCKGRLPDTGQSTQRYDRSATTEAALEGGQQGIVPDEKGGFEWDQRINHLPILGRGSWE
jgi:hypothetical protein